MPNRKNRVMLGIFIPPALREQIKIRAKQENRSVSNMAEVLLTSALLVATLNKETTANAS